MYRSRAFSLTCCLLFVAPLALAQAPGMPGPPDFPRRHEMRGPGMGMLPGGMWWKNPESIKLLNITSDQQKQLDNVFLQSRVQLIQMHASLEEEQVKLELLMNANPFDQSRAFAQISTIADLRADLEKTNARMLLTMRSVLSADQWTKLQAERRARHQGEGSEERGPGASRWQRGPQGGMESPGGPPPPASNTE